MTAAHVCPPDHRHSEVTTCYIQHKCRCESCVTKVITNQATRRRLMAYGRWEAYVDAGDARRHLQILAAVGIGYRRAAALANLSGSHVRDIQRGITKRLRPATAQRILTIPVDRALVAPGSLIDARGARRRLEALHAVGWSASALGEHLGVCGSDVRRMRYPDQITLGLYQRIADMYELLWAAKPTNSEQSQRQQRAAAAARGWVSPLGWDDIDLDDAPVSADHDAGDEDERAAVDGLDEIAVEIAVTGGRISLGRAERHAALLVLHARGHLDGELADLLRVDVRTIARDRKHFGLPANYFTATEVAA